MTTPVIDLRQAASSTAVAPPKRKVLSAYQEFLYRQALRITARGGSLGDVADYLQHAEQRPIRAVVEAQQDPTVDRDPGVIRGLAQQVLQGVTLFYGDEALGSLYGFLQGNPQMGRDLYRQELAAFQAQRPLVASAAQLAGAVALPLAAPFRAAKALGAGQTLAAGTVGAGVGAVAGAGATEGDLSDRAKAALWSAPFGFALGAATVPVARVAGEVAQAVGRRVAPVSREIGTRLQPIGKRLQGAIELLPGSPARVARRLLKQWLARDGLTPAQAASRVEQRSQHGLTTTVADVGGDHVAAGANLVQQFRTPEQQAFVQRLAQRGQTADARLLGEAMRSLRLGTQNAYELAEQLAAMRVRKSAPFYQEAFQQTVPVSNQLRRLLAEPRFRQAYEIGRQKANLEDLAAEMTGTAPKGLPVPELAPGGLRPGEQAQRMAGTTQGIEVTGARVTPPLSGMPQTRAGGQDLAIPDHLPVRALDYTKRGIDDMVNTFTAEGKPVLTRQDGRAMSDLLRVFRDEAGEAVPAYKQARAIWEDYSSQLDEMARAEGFLSKAPEAVAREVAAAKARSPQALEAYRVRAVQEIADALHGAGAQTTADRFFGARLFGTTDRSALRRIQALFDDRVTAEDFADKVAGEAASIATGRRLGRPGMPRPQTATRQLTPPGVTQRVLQRAGVRGQPSTKRAEAIANEVTNLFTRGLDDPTDLIALLRGLDALEEGAVRGAAILRTVAGQQAGRQERH